MRILYVIIATVMLYVLTTQLDYATEDLVIAFAGLDLIIAFIAIIKGFNESDMSKVFAGAFCGLMALSATQSLSTFTLILTILGGVVGVGSFIRRGFRDTFY